MLNILKYYLPYCILFVFHLLLFILLFILSFFIGDSKGEISFSLTLPLERAEGWRTVTPPVFSHGFFSGVKKTLRRASSEGLSARQTAKPRAYPSMKNTQSFGTRQSSPSATRGQIWWGSWSGQATRPSWQKRFDRELQTFRTPFG